MQAASPEGRARPSSRTARTLDARDSAELSRRQLSAAVAELVGRAKAHLGTPIDLEPLSAARAEAERDDTALARLVAAFELSEFERDVLLLAAAEQLDSEARAAIGPVTFGLALAIGRSPHWGAIAPNGALRRHRLLHADGSDVTGAPIRVDERVLHHLAGLCFLDPRLEAFVQQAAGTAEGEPAVDLLRDRSTEIVCAEPRTAMTLVMGSARARNRPLYVLVPESIPQAPAERIELVRLWEREARLLDAVLAVTLSAATDSRARENLLDFARRLDAPFVCCSHEPALDLARRVEIAPPPVPERAEALARRLRTGARVRPAIEAAVDHFSISLDDAPAIAAGFATETARGTTADRAIWRACRATKKARLDGLAVRIESRAKFADLIVPPHLERALRGLVDHVRHRHRVFREWGFGDLHDRDLGTAALFDGASGTGKTLAAEVIATELDLDLFRVDLSQVVSKYIGETEKHLARIFDAAEGSGAILLCDECDALFGKRSEVRDSHDRYANIEVSYLLQRIESYRGLAILTTNQKDAIDPAFTRRLRTILHFPFPDRDARESIWRRAIPERAPTDGLRFDRLSMLAASGGEIRNIAVSAAFLAAAAHKPLGMDHLLAAARSEYSKRDKSLRDSEVTGWV